MKKLFLLFLVLVLSQTNLQSQTLTKQEKNRLKTIKKMYLIGVDRQKLLSSTAPVFFLNQGSVIEYDNNFYEKDNNLIYFLYTTWGGNSFGNVNKTHSIDFNKQEYKILYNITNKDLKRLNVAQIDKDKDTYSFVSLNNNIFISLSFWFQKELQMVDQQGRPTNKKKLNFLNLEMIKFSSMNELYSTLKPETQKKFIDNVVKNPHIVKNKKPFAFIPEIKMILDAEYQDSVTIANILRAKKINAYVVKDWNYQFIIANSTSDLLKYAPQARIPFAFLITDNYLKIFTLPKAQEFTFQSNTSDFHYQFSINLLPGLENYIEQVNKLDKFDQAEKEQEFRKRFLDAWSLLSGELGKNYLSKDSVYFVRATYKSLNDDKKYFIEMNPNAYSLEKNAITLPLLTKKDFTIPEIYNFDNNYSYVNIPISISEAKNLVRDNKVFYEKIYKIRFEKIQPLIDNGHHQMTSKFKILSVKYNFYHENQWSSVYKEYVQKPKFEYEFIFENENFKAEQNAANEAAKRDSINAIKK